MWTCWWHPREGEGFRNPLPVGTGPETGTGAGEAFADALARRPFLPVTDLVARGPAGEEVGYLTLPSLPPPLPAPPSSPVEAPGEAEAVLPPPLPPRRRRRQPIRVPRVLREVPERIPWHLDPVRREAMRGKVRATIQATRKAKRAPLGGEGTPVSGAEEPAKVSAPER